MIPRKGYLRRKLKATLLRFAASILMHRNCTRSQVVSRRDNNDMWYMAEKLEAIADRISSGYPNA
ncbi:hypothetical protein [Pseudomonas fulva]|uniref:hypothetical protein n=1 Tax=Pseudomonas fulva TaxID=47880 RepID=UPI0018ABE4FA|nr:hypothetical protein [Pseudomonas fulva]MBF8679901.1 hypothetical protein [Pseudomonas fulva]MBF8717638.1 hypothetical protein [Pseudomonas fulva]MBF8784704.1 hypothetical protein [Pseudomonas fulva]